MIFVLQRITIHPSMLAMKYYHALIIVAITEFVKTISVSVKEDIWNRYASNSSARKIVAYRVPVIQ